MSEVIGSMPQIAPKKHPVALLWHSGGGAGEDRSSSGANCPQMSVVLGDVIDIGESALRYASAGPISRLRE
jgi:hypothetical protein